MIPHAKPIHQLISKNVGYAIDQHCPEEFILNIEQAVLIARHTELRPDVVLLSETAPDTSPVPPGDVLLVAEVISKSSQRADRDDKLKQYAGAGIPHYWIIDPLSERIASTQFVLEDDGQYSQLLQTEELVTVHRPWNITLDLPAWTRKRERIKANARPRD